MVLFSFCVVSSTLLYVKPIYMRDFLYVIGANLLHNNRLNHRFLKLYMYSPGSIRVVSRLRCFILSFLHGISVPTLKAA